MTTTIDSAGNVVGDTATQETAERIGAAVRAFAAALPADLWTSLSLQPDATGDLAWVDAVAADLGGQAETQRMTSGNWHRTADVRVGPLRVTVVTSAPEPPLAKRERLTAELAALDAQIAANGTEGDRG